MKRPVAVAIIAVLFGVTAWQTAGTAQTAAPPRLDRPRWFLGDHSTWQVQNSRKESVTEEWTVARQGDFFGTVAYYVDIAIPSTKSARTAIYDLNLALIGGRDDKGNVTFRREISWLRWPLLAGTKWSVQGLRSHATGTGMQATEFAGDVAVVGQERVDAGGVSYTALHVRFVWRDSAGQANPQAGQEDVWFSSQAPIFVKYRVAVGDYFEEGTLTSVSLAERVPSPTSSPVAAAYRRAAAINIVVRADPSRITSGQTAAIHVGLTTENGQAYAATTTYVLNVTLTTLSDLSLAKRTWVQQELRAAGLPPSWPPPNAAVALDPVATRDDLERWRLPPQLRGRLALQIDNSLRNGTMFELTPQRPSLFFLTQQEKGSRGYDFQLRPRFASGTFFVFAEIKGKVPARAVVQVEPAKAFDPFVVRAAAPSPPVLTFEHATTVQPAPPLRKPAYDFDLASIPPLDHECSVLLTVKSGPVAFRYLPPFDQTKRVEVVGPDTPFRVYVKPDADTIGTLEQVHIVATPDPGCGFSSGASLRFQLPPRFPKDVSLTVGENPVLGNGRQTIQFTANVFDEVGGFSVPPGRRMGLRLNVVPHGPGQLLINGKNPVALGPGDTSTATWELAALGDLWAEAQPSATVDGVDHPFPSYGPPLIFRFPYYYFALCVASLLPPLVYGKPWHVAALAYFVSMIYLVGGFFTALSDSAVPKAFPLQIAALPLSFWPAALVVCFGVGVLFALGGKWIFGEGDAGTGAAGKPPAPPTGGTDASA